MNKLKNRSNFKLVRLGVCPSVGHKHARVSTQTTVCYSAPQKRRLKVAEVNFFRYRVEVAEIMLQTAAPVLLKAA